MNLQNLLVVKCFLYTVKGQNGKVLTPDGENTPLQVKVLHSKLPLVKACKFYQQHEL